VIGIAAVCRATFTRSCASPLVHRAFAISQPAAECAPSTDHSFPVSNATSRRATCASSRAVSRRNAKMSSRCRNPHTSASASSSIAARNRSAVTEVILGIVHEHTFDNKPKTQ
jgi:hypothetical protein